MTATLGQLDLDEAAKEAAGNWQDFGSFCWHRSYDIEDVDQWAIVYTHHRDSGLLDLSNAEAIRQAITPFVDQEPCDVMGENHHHWAVGWIEGYAIRVYRNDTITEAFRTWHEHQGRLADYPVLDEEDYSRREYEATVENIAEAAWKLKNEYDLPEGWEGEVYTWLSDHNYGEIENRDDQGGYPSEEALRRAFATLGFTRLDED